MSANTLTLRGRVAAERLMVDTCRITRAPQPEDPGYTAPVFDEDTGQYSGPPRVVVYQGKCRVQVRSDINSNAVEGVVGEHEWTYRTLTVELPIAGTEEVKPNCTLEVLTSPLDPSRVGIVINLMADTKNKTHSTHRRYRGRELVG